MTQRTPEGEALTDLILETFRLNGAMLDAGNQLTKPVGLTSARWQVMGAIELADRPITVAQIARRMGLSRQGVQRLVTALESQGMLHREDNIDDKRAPLVVISEQGAAAMRAINERQHTWVNQLAAGLSKEQLDVALTILRTVRERSESDEPSGR